MLSSSLVDKILGMLAAFVVGLPLAAWMHLWGYFSVGLVLTISLTAILFFPRILPWSALTWLAALVRKRIDASQLLDAATVDRRLLLISFVLSVVSWFTTYVQFYLAFRAFHGDVTLGHILAFTPIIMLTKLLPLTLDGLGPQEVASVGIFRSIGVPDHVTLLASLAFRAVGSWLPALVGVVLILTSRRWLASRPGVPQESSL